MRWTRGEEVKMQAEEGTKSDTPIAFTIRVRRWLELICFSQRGGMIGQCRRELRVIPLKYVSSHQFDIFDILIQIEC